MIDIEFALGGQPQDLNELALKNSAVADLEGFPGLHDNAVHGGEKTGEEAKKQDESREIKEVTSKSTLGKTYVLEKSVVL